MKIKLSTKPGIHNPDPIYTIQVTYDGNQVPAGFPKSQSYSSKGIENLYRFLDEKMGLCCFGLGSKDEPRARCKGGFGVGSFGFCGEQDKGAVAGAFKRRLKVVVVMNVDVFPVVQPCAAQLLCVGGEPQRVHQMQRCAGGGAQPSDVAGVGRYLRIYQYYVQAQVDFSLPL